MDRRTEQKEVGPSGDAKAKTFAVTAPSVNLPKGGGAIRGIGEKFAANPVTGTGSMTVPIATSPGRSGFGPQLSLSYDSGAGNGPFGFGWNLSLPSITRKTDKGLPNYQDADEADIFILSGAEDLVPVLIENNGKWERERLPPRTVGGKTYRIQRYRPRIEGLLARIERWTHTTDPQDTFWRSISKDNITTWYGKTPESRIADPADPTRIFTWLICESYDDKGNVIVYGYKAENSDNVALSQAHERNRTELTRSANRYLKRIRYGNHTPYRPTLSATAPWPEPPGATALDGSEDWFFELVFDYGEHDENAPVPQDTGKTWDCRNDPFSTYRATFEVRTYRLCQRVLMFHHFPEEAGVGHDCLVRSTDFTYSYEETPADPRNPIYSFLLAVSQTGYQRQAGGYLATSLPPLEFEYTQPTIDETLHDVDPKSLENLPYGLDGTHYQWVDLDGEGLSGILTEQAETWFYKRNLSPLKDPNGNGRETPAARFGPIEPVARRPSLAALGARRQQLLDLAGDGQLDLVDFEGPTPGFFERTEDENWEPFAPFSSLPNLDWGDPNLKFVDLTGDGHADLLITKDDAFCWYESLAKAGFGPEERVLQSFDEEKGPKLIFADLTQSTFLADLSGDGLTDLVRIRNGEVCYWPNLGYGRFGAKVTMDNAPWFETPDLFDGRRLRLADIDGTGTTDIVYFASTGVQLYFNQSGNGWSPKRALGQFPPVDSVSSAMALDLLGNGTACLVWSSPLPGQVRQVMRYVDLMGGQKPHLLVKVTNNLGAETRVQYAPSTQFYVADRLAGTPWVTRLPFPVHVVERVETYDYVSRNRFVTRYVYHHGFYDGIEREFRGFGMVEQFDTEEFEKALKDAATGTDSYTFSTVDAPGATSTFLRSINSTGQMVGQVRDSTGVLHSLLIDRDAFSTFDPPGFTRTAFPGISTANGINDAGEVVGSVQNNDNQGAQAYRLSGGVFSLYSHPDAGPSGITDFEGINNAGVRVGSYSDNTGAIHGIVQVGGSTTLLETNPNVPANTGTFIFDINHRSQMVGGYFDPVTGSQHGFLTDGNTFTTIDYPGSSTTWLNGINDRGQMVGAYLDNATQRWHGFLTDGKTFNVLDFSDVPGQRLETFLTGIDNAGRIVGFYGNDLGQLNQAGIHGLLATPAASNTGQFSSPPTCTKTWFHTGAYLGEERISKHFEEEYYHEGDASDAVAELTDKQLEAMLLDDTVLPTHLTGDERRQAARSLKGSILRQEIYALDGTDAADRPYSASERNYTIEVLQPQGPNRHAVFFAHARETVDFHYERKLFDIGGDRRADPRVTHALTLEVDDYGNVLKAASIGYGRRFEATDPALLPQDRDKQRLIHITLSENLVTNAIDDVDKDPDDYRTPLPCETRTYELRKPEQEKSSNGLTQLYAINDLLGYVDQAGDGKHDVAYEDLEFAKAKQAAVGNPEESNKYFRRMIERVRTLYRPNDMGLATGDPKALLTLGQIESLALPGESYKLAFTLGLLSQVYQRGPENLLPVPANVLGGTGPDRGGYIDLNGDGHWWIPSGRIFHHPDPSATPQQELDQARQHFFLPRRFEDPFGQSSTVDYDEPFDLLVVRTTDAMNNTVTARNAYRVLQPMLVTDPNDNRAAVSFDALGLVAGTAVMGKTTENLGDSLDTFVPDLSAQQIDAFFGADDPHTVAASLLGTATTRIIYDVDRFKTTRNANPTDPSQWQPVFAATLARETHFKDPVPPGGLKIQISFSYSDGFGREIQKKIQAESGPVIEGGPMVDPRWVGSGWTIFNNKGKPVRQYEPFFSQLPTKRHQFEFGFTVGVSPILCYDPVQRVVATIHPNHTYEKVVFDPWRQETFDVNDTVTFDPKADPDVGSFFALLPEDDYLPTWYTRRSDGALGTEEQDAANKAAAHANTPTVAYFDTLGRTFLTIASNRFQRQGTTVEESYPTRVALDIEGNQREVRDAIVQAGDPQGRIVMRYDYDMLGNRIHQASMEAGERWMLNDVTGKPIRAWDSRGHTFRTEYDALRRPIKALVQGADPQNLNREILFEQTLYGEGQPNDKSLNLRTRVFKHFDTAGVVTSLGRNPVNNQDEAYDFKGNLLRASRELAQDYKGLIDWKVAQPPGEVFSTSTTYDALNRPTVVTSPDKSVYRPTYNEANLLDKVEVNLRGTATATPFVTNIDYNAKGQRTRIDYGNGTSTDYEYEKDTFRLIHLDTRSGNTALQDLRYTYDPAGNITHIRDDAQQTVYFNGQVIEPHCDYTYDAIYRLIEAKGREHIGQLAQPETTWNDQFRVNLPHPQDGQAMRNYTEQYDYDAVGNFEKLIHQAANGSWTRGYAYSEPSLLEPTTKISNRQSSTTIGRTTGDLPSETYAYDAHGNMIQMPHLTQMQWDFKDQLRTTSTQVVNNSTSETTFYVYDTSGQRVRKVTERKNGTRKDERIYLGGFEIYREYDGMGNTVTLERETLHVMDDKQRIALVETKTVANPNDDSPPQLIRYQFGNQLSSASLELNDQAQVISYEEYYPYGSTSYQAVNKVIKVAAKRYRYTGKERDEETGLYYHGARYYAPWLGRWTSCDPKTSVISAYVYVSNRPTIMVDPNGMDERKGVLDNIRSFAGGALEASGMIILNTVKEKAATIITAAEENPVGFVTNTSFTIAKGEAKKEYEALKQMATLQDPSKASAAERWALAANQRYNPAVGAVEHFPQMVESLKRGDYGAAGTHYQQAAISVVSTVLAATGAVEGAKALPRLVESGSRGGAPIRPSPGPSPEPGPEPSPKAATQAVEAAAPPASPALGIEPATPPVPSTSPAIRPAAARPIYPTRDFPSDLGMPEGEKGYFGSSSGGFGVRVGNVNKPEGRFLMSIHEEAGQATKAAESAASLGKAQLANDLALDPSFGNKVEVVHILQVPPTFTITGPIGPQGPLTGGALQIVIPRTNLLGIGLVKIPPK